MARIGRPPKSKNSSSITDDGAAERLRRIKRAIQAFPAEVRRQEREARHDQKIRKAFGKIVIPEPKKITMVRQHSRHVQPSEAYPDGLTTVHRHPRRLPGTSLNPEGIREIFKTYNRGGIIYPAKGKLREYPTADEYDDLIAVWVDFFNKEFSETQPLDPDVLKALIASESGFQLNPKNPLATGIAQITDPTWKIVQNPAGEAKDFIFSKIRKVDLKDPQIAIPVAVRWLRRKQALAEIKLRRPPTAEEIILEYKGLLKSKTQLREKARKIFKKYHDLLKT